MVHPTILSTLKTETIIQIFATIIQIVIPTITTTITTIIAIIIAISTIHATPLALGIIPITIETISIHHIATTTLITLPIIRAIMDNRSSGHTPVQQTHFNTKNNSNSNNRSPSNRDSSYRNSPIQSQFQ